MRKEVAVGGRFDSFLDSARNNGQALESICKAYAGAGKTVGIGKSSTWMMKHIEK